MLEKHGKAPLQRLKAGKLYPVCSKKFHYYGITEAQMKSYGESLVEAGLKKTEDGNNESGQLYQTYKKGDLIVKIGLYIETTQMVVRIINDEMWFW